MRGRHHVNVLKKGRRKEKNMKSKLVASIAIAMIAVVAFSMLSVLPAHAVTTISMAPSVNPPTKAIGFKWNITVSVSGWGAPPVFAYQVKMFIINPAAGVIITRAWSPKLIHPAAFIFTGHATASPTPAVTPTSALVGDTCLDVSAVPPPDPAELAIIELQIVGAPGKYQTLETPLNINNADTYLLDDALSTIPGVVINDGTYTWVWTPPTVNPNVAVHLVDPGLAGATLIDAQHLVFDQYHLWNGVNFVAKVYLENLDVGWAISGAAFSLSYNPTCNLLVSAVLDPAWTGVVNTGTLGTIAVSATTTSALSGNVVVLTVTFTIQGQQLSPPAPTGYFDVSHLDLTGIALQDTVGPIPVNLIRNGVVTIYAKQALLSPWLSVTPTPIVSGTDLVIGNQFGKTFTVDVKINALHRAWNLVAVQFRLQYDADLVQFVSATEGPYLGQFDNGLGTFFVAQNTLNDVLYGDNVAIGDLLLPDANGTWTIFPGDVPETGPLGSGVIATLTFAYIKQDFVNTYNMPLTLADFGLPPAQQVYFVDVLGNTIPAGPNQNGLVIIQPISTIGRRIDVWMQYPAPFGGQGLMQPADLVVPQQIIILTAKVTYNWWPVVNKKVTFNVYDNNWNLVAVLEAMTGPDGHATTSYRMPWPDVNPEGLFGVWHVYASVSVADVTVLDILSFHYDYLVEILNAHTDKVSYNHLDYMAVTVTYGSHAQQMYPVWMTATLQDNLLVPVSVAFTGLAVQGAVYCQLKVYPAASLTLYVPYYAYAGAAQVRVDFLDKTPMDGTHVAVTPEYAITGIYILPV